MRKSNSTLTTGAHFIHQGNVLILKNIEEFKGIKSLKAKSVYLESCIFIIVEIYNEKQKNLAFWHLDEATDIPRAVIQVLRDMDIENSTEKRVHFVTAGDSPYQLLKLFSHKPLQQQALEEFKKHGVTVANQAKNYNYFIPMENLGKRLLVCFVVIACIINSPKILSGKNALSTLLAIFLAILIEFLLAKYNDYSAKKPEAVEVFFNEGLSPQFKVHPCTEVEAKESYKLLSEKERRRILARKESPLCSIPPNIIRIKKAGTTPPATSATSCSP